MRKRSVHTFFFLLWLGIFLGLGAEASEKVRTGPGKTFVFERFNRTYQDLSPELAAVRQGPLTINVSSPRHVIILRDHVLNVRPDQNGALQANFSAEFEGVGDLIADLDLMGFNGSMEDRFKIPLQEKRINGAFRVIRVEAGYRVIPVSQPKEVEVKIQTGMGKRVLGWCLRMAEVPLSPLKCGGLDRALSRLKIPLPKDSYYFVHDRDLTVDEREEIDRFLKEVENSRS